MTIDRRHFLTGAVGTTLATAAATRADEAPSRPKRANRIAVSTYSFWQFRHKDLRDIETGIDLAADMGFDGVEILHRQMQDESNAYLQKLEQRAFRNGLDLCGFSTHQTFLSPKKRGAAEERRAHAPLHRAGLPAGHPNHAGQHRHLGHQQELR